MQEHVLICYFEIQGKIALANYPVSQRIYPPFIIRFELLRLCKLQGRGQGCNDR